MRNKKPYNIPTLREIYDYIFRRHANGQRHRLERKMQQDPFLDDAVEGFSHVDEARATSDINILNQRLTKEKNKTPAYWYTGIAASLLLLIIAGAVFLMMDNSRRWQQEPQLAREQERIENLQESLSEIDTVSQTAMPAEEEPATETETAGSGPRLARQQPATPVTIADADHEFTDSESIPAGDTILITLNEDATAQDDNLSKTDTSLPHLEIMAEEQEPAKKSTGAVAVVENPAVLLPQLVIEPDTRVVKGQVVDGLDQTPVPGVTVNIAGTTQGTVTDMNGFFELEIPDHEHKDLVISFIGYGTLEVAAADVSVDKPLALYAELAALEEVVVTGYGISNRDVEQGHEQSQHRNDRVNRRDYSPPMPVEGYSHLNRYLKDNALLPDTAQQAKVVVVLRFEIAYTGQPVNFEVLRSPSPVYAEMAIDMIRNGPEWKPATLANNFEQESVRVRIVFRKGQ
ncbi:MAG: carboxypeptidase-like regulatory domain-containing protein [Bacteroidota bacterium]